MPLIDQWQGFTGLPDFSDPPAIPTDLKALFDFMASRAVPRYASEGARDAELTSPIAGQMCWVDATTTLYVWSAAGWRPIYYDTGWMDITFANGWAGTGQYRVINSVCYMQGSASGGSGTTVGSIGVRAEDGSNLNTLIRANASAAAFIVAGEGSSHGEGSLVVGSGSVGDTLYFGSVTPFVSAPV